MSSPRRTLVLTGLACLLAGPWAADIARAGATGVAASPGGPTPGEACIFAGPALRCVAAANENLAVIVARFAHPGTAALLQALGDDYSDYRTRSAREAYRQSVERNNERSIRLLEQAARDRRRGRLSAEGFEEQRRLHLRAFENYRTAIRFYQRAQWFDPDVPRDDALPPIREPDVVGDGAADPPPGTG